MGDIRNFVIMCLLVMIAVAAVLLGFKADEVKTLQKQLTTIQAASKQLAETKQSEVDDTHKRANEYLGKVKVEYEKRVNVNPVSRFNRLHKPTTTTPNTTNTVRSFQEPAGMVEPKQEVKEKAEDSACMENYKELWETWHGLCLIYGCTD